jgi:hypothetical protein
MKKRLTAILTVTALMLTGCAGMAKSRAGKNGNVATPGDCRVQKEGNQAADGSGGQNDSTDGRKGGNDNGSVEDQTEATTEDMTLLRDYDAVSNKKFTLYGIKIMGSVTAITVFRSNSMMHIMWIRMQEMTRLCI